MELEITPVDSAPGGPLAGSKSVAPDAPMRWDGWGDPRLAKDLPLAVRALLPLKLGRVQKPAPATALGKVEVSSSRLSEEDRAALAAVVGAAHVTVDAESRLRHAGGKSTPDLLRRREPSQTVPDGVIAPADHDEVLAVLQLASERGVAVVPFGGGTSVVGALDPESGPHHAVIALDLRRLSGLIELDELSGQARFLAGTTGPEAEQSLLERGWELGHYPQSFLYATLGGFAAARSSGQNSAGNGRFETMVLGMRVATPSGEGAFGVAPGTSVGPDLMRMFLGSEGTLGIITELTLRVHRVPEARMLEGWTFPDFHSATTALREVAQLRDGAGPTVIRLSDEAETAVSLAQHGRIGNAIAAGCSAVTVFEGSATEARARRDRVAEILGRNRGTSAGSSPARGWLEGRFSAPYLRDALLGHGVLCETLETATTWANLEPLKRAVTAAIEGGFTDFGGKCLVLCHVSHIYATGAALYFTIVGNVRGNQLATWQSIKQQVTEAIVEHGGTISHHHGVGRDHAPWLEREVGELGIRMLAAIKRELDPKGIMNPGALLATQRPGDG